MLNLLKKRNNFNFQTIYFVFLKSLIRQKGLWIIVAFSIISMIIFQVITSYSAINQSVRWYYSIFVSSFGDGFEEASTTTNNFGGDYWAENAKIAFTFTHLNFLSRGSIFFTSSFSILGLYVAYTSFISKRNKGSLLVFLSTKTNKSRLLWANIAAMMTVVFSLMFIFAMIESILTREIYNEVLRSGEVDIQISSRFKNYFIFQQTTRGVNPEPFKLHLIQSMENEILSRFSVINILATFAGNFSLYLLVVIFSIGLTLAMSSFMNILTISIIFIGVSTLLSIALPIFGILEIENKDAILSAMKLILPINAIDDLKASLFLELGGSLSSSNVNVSRGGARLGSFGNATFKSWSGANFWLDPKILAGVLVCYPAIFLFIKHFTNKRGDWK